MRRRRDFGRDLDELVFRNEFNRLLEVHEAGRGEAQSFVRRRGAHVGELLFADGVDVEIVVARVLTDDHAFVDFDAAADEKHATILHAEERVGGGGSRAVADQSAGETLRNLALVGHVAVEEGVHDDGAAGLRQHFGAQADDAAAGYAELHAHAARPVVVHLGHLTLARSELFDDDAGELFGNVDGEVLDGLHLDAVDGLDDDFRAADHQFEAFAAHHFDQYAELHFAAAEDLEAVRRARLFHADGDVGQQFAIETLAQIAAGDELAFFTAEGRVVHRKLDGDGRLIDDDERQRHRVFDAGQGLADGDAFDAGDSDDVADLGLRGLGALQAGEGEELGDLDLLQRQVAAGEHDFVADMQRALEDAGDGDAAEVLGVVEVGDEDLERCFRVADSGRNGLDDRLEERLKIGAGNGHVRRGCAVLGDAVEDGKIELVFFGIEIDEEIVDFVQDFLNARVGAVDLVDDHHGLELGGEGLGQHVAGLGQRAFGCIDQEHDAIDHLESALDFAAEIGVARSVDDVDLAALEEDGGVLGENGDAALALEVVGVHDAVGDLLHWRGRCRTDAAWRQRGWSSHDRHGR